MTTSWVIRRRDTGEVICETYDRSKISLINLDKYEAVPIYDYLVEFNRKVQEDMREDV